MDFNGDVHVEQRGRSEESRLDTLNGGEKIQQIENEDKSDPADIEQKGSKDSSRGSGFLKFLGNQQSQKAKHRGGNCKKMCYHDKKQKHQRNVSDGNSGRMNSVGENNGEQKIPEQSYNNYGKENPVIEFDGNRSDTPYRNCKSGINISVVSRGEPKAEDIEIEKPMYSVSFKCCYDNNNSKCNSKRRKFSPTNCSNTKKFKLLESNKNENVLSIQQVTGNGAASNQPNYRCTFENCCGNCESYIVEIPSNDCSTYKNWQSSDFDSRNTCFEDCCCPREMKVYSSNLSVLPRGSCGGCVESEKCCSSSHEQKCDFILDDCHTPSKHYLQHVHFAKYDDRPKRNHSSCSFCSRKCTPSKASLFVEIGESVADVCNLSSVQAYQCAESMESLKDCATKIGYGTVKKNRSDTPRGKSEKRSHPRCNPSCRGAPGSVARTHSDRVACVDGRVDDYTIDQEMPCSEMLRNARSHVSFQEVQDCREQMESDMYINKTRPNCNQQCETDERSLWDDIRRGKIWVQLQDTYKSFVRVAATGIGQIVKQSSKLNRSKKSTKDSLTCGTSTKECEENFLCAEQCNQWGTCNDCLYEGSCWNEIMTHDSNNCEIHCCTNACCDSIAGLPECQKPMCQNDRWECKGNTQKPLSQANYHFDSSDNVHRNVDPTYMVPLKEPLCSKYNTVRERGGADQSNQKKKPPNSNKRPNQNVGENPGPSDQREKNNNTKNQMSQRTDRPLEMSDQQLNRSTMHIDVSVQANAIRTMVEPPNAPIVTESLAYRKRIRTVRQIETFPDENIHSLPSAIQRGPVIQEVDSTLHPVRPAIKKHSYLPKTSNTQRPASSKSRTTSVPSKYKDTKPGTSRMPNTTPRQENNQRDRQITRPDRPGAKTAITGQGVQCVIIQDIRLVCAPAGSNEATDQTGTVCLCKLTTTTPQHDETTGAARNGTPTPRVPEDPPAESSVVAQTVEPVLTSTPVSTQAESTSPRHVNIVAPAETPTIQDITEQLPTSIENVVEPSPESVIEPRPESVIEPRPEGVIEPRPEGVIEPRPEGVIAPRPEGVIEPRPESVIEPRPESVIEPRPESVIQPRPESVIELRPESVIEPRPESVIEPRPESVIELRPESVIEPRPEGVIDPRPESVIEPETRDATIEQPTIENADVQGGSIPSADATSPSEPRSEYPDEVESQAIPLDSTISESEMPAIVMPATQSQQPLDYSLPDYYGTFTTETTEYLLPPPTEIHPGSTITPVPAQQIDLVRSTQQEPVEISKIFNGKETHVTVEMQTSSTILTKILSEFQIGNKKRQVLMSIKVHTNMDENVAASDQQPPSGSRNNTGTTRQLPQLDVSRSDKQRQTNQPDSYRSTTRRAVRGPATPAHRAEEPDLCDSHHNMCKGPCGRKKQ